MNGNLKPDDDASVNCKVLAAAFAFAGYAMTFTSDCVDRAAADAANRLLVDALTEVGVEVDIPDCFGEKGTGAALAAVEEAISKELRRLQGSDAADLFGFARRSYDAGPLSGSDVPANGLIYDDVLRTLFKVF